MGRAAIAAIVVAAICCGGCATSNKRMLGWGLVGGGVAATAGFMGLATYQSINAPEVGSGRSRHKDIGPAWESFGISFGFCAAAMLTGAVLVWMNPEKDATDEEHKAVLNNQAEWIKSLDSRVDRLWERENRRQKRLRAPATQPVQRRDEQAPSGPPAPQSGDSE